MVYDGKMERIVYLISAYTDKEQLLRTIDALDTGDCLFFIHLDRKAKMELPERDRVTVLGKRYFIQWGGWNQVLYQKLLLEAFLACPEPYSRAVLISGQDYPLRSANQVREAFELYPRKQYVRGLNLSALDHPGPLHEKVVLYHFFRDLPCSPGLKRFFSGSARQVMRILPIRKKPYLMVEGRRWDVYQASSYMALTRDCAQYVVSQMQENKTLMSYFRYSFVPEELVIPTILFNSPFREECELKQVYVFREKDRDGLLSCGKLFARKMQSGISEPLMERLQEYFAEASDQ